MAKDNNKFKLDETEQGDILSFARQSFESYRTDSQDYRNLMQRVYESLSTFELPDTGAVITRFKVNKAHEIVRKVVPRIFAKNPKIQVSAKTDSFFESDELATGETRAQILERNQKLSRAVQDYLNVLFEDQDLQESLKHWVLNQITYGNAFAEIVTDFEVQRSKTFTDKGQEVTEKVIGVKPDIDIISWTEAYYDPKFMKLKQMPGFFRVRTGVRLQHLEFMTDEKGDQKYFNLDKVQELAGKEFTGQDSYRDIVYAVTGVQDVVMDSGIDKNALELGIYYAKYSITGDPKDERLYEITTVNWGVLIGFEEITQIPIVDIKGHEDPEVFFAVGLVAPILGLQDELNFQKNAQATAMSKSLNRSYIWSPDSGIDPQDLVSDVPGNIIVASQGLDAAKRGFEEQVNVPLPSQYFNNINDYNRDINNLTHTTDVAGQQGQQALTNTATGARISFFESSAVINELRKNFERGVQELSYKLLEWTVNNIDNNIIIKKIDTEGFLEINKEAFKNALERYEIRVEAGSSAFDDVENRRNDAIAIKNLMLEGLQAGANINIDAGFRNIFSTFEGLDVDAILPAKEEAPEELLGLLGGGAAPGAIPKGGEAGAIEEGDAAAITERVAGGTQALAI